jgi:hypothetical protein
MAVDAEGKKPIVVDLALGEVCDCDLDAIVRICESTSLNRRYWPN